MTHKTPLLSGLRLVGPCIAMLLITMLLMTVPLLSMPGVTMSAVTRAAVVDASAPLSPEEDPANWYQIDIILFTPTRPNPTEENWQIAEPSYPHDVIAMTQGQEVLPFRLSQLAQLRKEAREVALVDAVLHASQSTDDTSTNDTGNQDEAAAEQDDADTLAFGKFAFESALATSSMTALASRMRRSSQYQVWAHRSWTQPITEQARPMMLQAGQGLDDRYAFEGTLSFRRTRYIHLRPHIWYTQYAPRSSKPPPRTPSLVPGLDDLSPEVEQALVEVEARRGLYTPLQTYHITWEQRLRTGEMHYLDHPLLGLLVRVRHYALPDALPDTD